MRTLLAIALLSVLDEFIAGFWVCFITLLFYAPLTFIITRRPQTWLRMLDAGESFLRRLGFSKRVASFGRAFSETRGFAVIMIVFTCVMSLLVLVHAACFLYFRHRST